MKVWNNENEYDIEGPNGSIYRVKIYSPPDGFEDEYASRYSGKENDQVIFPDCWFNIERLEENENIRNN